MEKTVLKHMLTNSTYFDKIFSKIDSKLFNDPSYELIFNTITSHVQEYNKKPSLKEVALSIKESNKINKNIKKPTLDKFKELALDTGIDNIDYLLDKTLEWVKKNRLTSAIFESADIIQNGGEFEPIVDMFENALEVNFDTSVGLDYGSSLDDRLDYYKSKETFTPIGLRNLDESLGGGIRPSSLFMYAGPTHSGKCHHYDTILELYITDEELERIKKSGVEYEYQEVYKE